LLIDNGQLSIDNCLNYAAQIAEGLQAAHAKSITHRDIKSSNIMVMESGQVKIMDFGLAKIAGGAQLTKDHSTLGTAAYMSPGQARGEPVDHRTDIRDLQQVQTSGVASKQTTTAQTRRAVSLPRLSFLPGGLAIIALVVGLFFYNHRNQPIDSIAVLPFVNANNDPDLEYLSNGLTETIINKLSQLPQLKVMARSTVFHFKGKGVSPLEVGRELGVKAVLSGNIVQRGDILRLQAELVNISDGAQLWGAQYNPQLDDIFSVQKYVKPKPNPALPCGRR
jgi:TolB-like protein